MALADMGVVHVTAEGYESWAGWIAVGMMRCLGAGGVPCERAGWEAELLRDAGGPEGACR
jgi:hypothetical protein